MASKQTAKDMAAPAHKGGTVLKLIQHVELFVNRGDEPIASESRQPG